MSSLIGERHTTVGKAKIRGLKQTVQLSGWKIKPINLQLEPQGDKRTASGKKFESTLNMVNSDFG